MCTHNICPCGLIGKLSYPWLTNSGAMARGIQYPVLGLEVYSSQKFVNVIN